MFNGVGKRLSHWKRSENWGETNLERMIVSDFWQKEIWSDSDNPIETAQDLTSAASSDTNP